LGNGEYDLALAEGSWEAALAVSEKLIELFAGKSIHWHRARALLNPAQVFTRRGAPGDLERAQKCTTGKPYKPSRRWGSRGYMQAIQQKINVAAYVCRIN